MRQAIKGANVTLNTAIVPGVILISSSLIILDKPIEGYNNVLTVADLNMKFGENQKVNFSETMKEESPGGGEITPKKPKLPENRITPKRTPSAKSKPEVKKEESTAPVTPRKNIRVPDDNSNVLIMGTTLVIGSVLSYLIM